jgi:hypothetical protein
MMKTPEEIKKGLECCVAKPKGLTVKDCDIECPYFHEGVFCKNALHGDTKQIIQQLEYEKLGNLRSIEKMAKYIKELEITNDVAHTLVCEGVIERNELKARLAQVELERDAAVDALYGECEMCFWDDNLSDKCLDCIHNENVWMPNSNYWQWRGVCEENTKEDAKE